MQTKDLTPQPQDVKCSEPLTNSEAGQEQRGNHSGFASPQAHADWMAGKEARRREYIEKVRESTRQIADRKTHRHQAVTEQTVGYRHCVASVRCNPVAHGGVMFVEHCACGARRETNSNAGKLERSGWVRPIDASVLTP